jgi:hypothetical protein
MCTTESPNIGLREALSPSKQCISSIHANTSALLVLVGTSAVVTYRCYATLLFNIVPVDLWGLIPHVSNDMYGNNP